MGNSNLLFESIFKRKLSAADNRGYLARITVDHPYFSPARFFLLLSTEKGTADYRQLAAKTSILFNNPHWLQFQLQEEELNSGKSGDAGLAGNNAFITAENREDFFSELDRPAVYFDDNEPVIISQEEATIAGSAPGIPNEEPAVPEPPGTIFDNIEEKDTGPVINEDHLLELVEDIQEPVTENTAEPEKSEYISARIENNAEEIITEKGTGTGIEKTGQSLPEQENAIDAPEISGAEHTADGTAGSTHPPHFNNQSTPLVNETEIENEPSTEKEIAPLNFKLNIEPIDTTEDKITFEPLHTSDYFASLGIKLSGDIKPGDKLGKQLKSFTEWLKTMKKIHSDQLTPLTGQADMSIQKLAEQSNKEDTVVTEAMADVLLMQGKAGKAIEVYKKLSLLNPAKSTYFAAKIDQLKAH